MVCEGIAQKAKKMLKETKSVGLDWDWLNNIIKVDVKKTEAKDSKAVFLEEIVAYVEYFPAMICKSHGERRRCSACSSYRACIADAEIIGTIPVLILCKAAYTLSRCDKNAFCQHRHAYSHCELYPLKLFII